MHAEMITEWKRNCQIFYLWILFKDLEPTFKNKIIFIYNDNPIDIFHDNNHESINENAVIKVQIEERMNFLYFHTLTIKPNGVLHIVHLESVKLFK